MKRSRSSHLRCLPRPSLPRNLLCQFQPQLPFLGKQRQSQPVRLTQEASLRRLRHRPPLRRKLRGPSRRLPAHRACPSRQPNASSCPKLDRAPCIPHPPVRHKRWAVCSVANLSLNVLAHRVLAARAAQALPVERPSAPVPRWVPEACGVRCIPRASIRQALPVRVREWEHGQASALRALELAVRREWRLRRRERRTVPRAATSRGVVGTIATRNPKKAQ